jgi:hypothetical protein
VAGDAGHDDDRQNQANDRRHLQKNKPRAHKATHNTQDTTLARAQPRLKTQSDSELVSVGVQ